MGLQHSGIHSTLSWERGLTSTTRWSTITRNDMRRILSSTCHLLAINEFLRAFIHAAKDAVRLEREGGGRDSRETTTHLWHYFEEVRPDSYEWTSLEAASMHRLKRNPPLYIPRIPEESCTSVIGSARGRGGRLTLCSENAPNRLPTPRVIVPHARKPRHLHPPPQYVQRVSELGAEAVSSEWGKMGRWDARSVICSLPMLHTRASSVYQADARPRPSYGS
jgi:hypothetical protein